ncbi:bifunctional (p)ppGpp synthetase/guanosine-3',5'-bis(diphosphate) 3'-pyrophosphohydrolase [Serpentinicella sp. ANB-PHB4]|uniref:RelA/SpoT family protein n=1 Tax=Serpentinicella sp. ANB-PHB4 TaxID=3074076 RepID=UPI0028674EE2|nr:bifunctional (p)ppGpp synthetase/guanosine-3',5'-bis(diphosphate) 3'-pyrophosphohydrolase [Serpentinicella sp. ANB-PHB4]MDR5658069.1 bifunctional (p)ppGpp synthetase/guanosine-3',5'-bis(diphosphate) 3'-pyrophosphohydrolase [Serpentinicella sp. ANB-PHB4]
MIDNLIAMIESYNPNCDVDLIIKAYNFSENAHEGQMRKSGERFFTHPIEVAKILIQLQLDSSTIAAGLLHDVIEDTSHTYNEISQEFSEEVAQLVDGVTKLTRLTFDSKEERQAENLRKMFIAMAKDIRVILIKLADRLHNMRTLKFQSDEKKKEKALETLEIFAPIANRLGIFKIKWELEDLCLRYIDAEGYYDLVEKVAQKRKDREQFITDVISQLENRLDEFNITNEISGRPKHFYSIYRKMKYQGKSFDEIFDFLAVRILVNSIKDCYGVLGVVHTLWKPIPGRFKDYIAMPKPNMYQSLHTTVIGPKGEPFEIQIRTYEMHHISEYGIAAHWKYKESKPHAPSMEMDDKLVWLRQMLEWEKETKDPKEFMESLKIDLFTNEVFVFTPKGKVINLPLGSTPIDFAYKIHSDIGNKCVGAKVDGRIVPLDYKLKNGNIIEVLTSTNSNGPSRDWLKVVKSSQANARIKQWFKKERREENLIKGKEMVEKEIRRKGITVTESSLNRMLNSISKKLSLSNEEDLYATIGYGGITLNQVIPKIREQIKKEMPKEEQEKEIIEPLIKNNNTDKKKNKGQGVTVKGIDNIMVRFARCCNPVPGDDIMGYITRGRGVSIHRKDCPSLHESAETVERFIEVNWDSTKPIAFNVELQVKATDRKGLLSELTKILSDARVTVSSLNARTNKEKIALLNLVLEINDTEDLNKIMTKFKNVKGVIDVFRVLT